MYRMIKLKAIPVRRAGQFLFNPDKRLVFLSLNNSIMAKKMPHAAIYLLPISRYI